MLDDLDQTEPKVEYVREQMGFYQLPSGELIPIFVTRPTHLVGVLVDA